MNSTPMQKPTAPLLMQPRIDILALNLFRYRGKERFVKMLLRVVSGHERLRVRIICDPIQEKNCVSRLFTMLTAVVYPSVFQP